MVVGKQDWGTWAQGGEGESKVSILPSNLTFFSQVPSLKDSTTAQQGVGCRPSLQCIGLLGTNMKLSQRRLKALSRP